VKTTPQGHSLYQLAPSTPLIEGIESGLWGTPRSCEVMAGNLTEKMADRPGGNLEEQVALKLWPTPKARDHKDGRTEGTQGRHSPDLGKVVGQSKKAGALNPMWVEWLMGFPLGWTDLNV